MGDGIHVCDEGGVETLSISANIRLILRETYHNNQHDIILRLESLQGPKLQVSRHTEGLISTIEESGGKKTYYRASTSRTAKAYQIHDSVSRDNIESEQSWRLFTIGKYRNTLEPTKQRWEIDIFQRRGTIATRARRPDSPSQKGMRKHD